MNEYRPIIEILSNGPFFRARFIDGSLETGEWSAPERAVDALIEMFNRGNLSDQIRSIRESGAGSGCYVDNDMLEAHGDHPAAANMNWGLDLSGYYDPND